MIMYIHSYDNFFIHSGRALEAIPFNTLACIHIGNILIIAKKYFASIPTKTWDFGDFSATHDTNASSTYFGLHETCFSFSTDFNSDKK